jgi:hypothetical protein
MSTAKRVLEIALEAGSLYPAKMKYTCNSMRQKRLSDRRAVGAVHDRRAALKYDTPQVISSLLYLKLPLTSPP